MSKPVESTTFSYRTVLSAAQYRSERQAHIDSRNEADIARHFKRMMNSVADAQVLNEHTTVHFRVLVDIEKAPHRAVASFVAHMSVLGYQARQMKKGASSDNTTEEADTVAVTMD